MPGEGKGRDRGECWWQIVWWGFIPTRAQQEGELGLGGRAEGEMRLGEGTGEGGGENGGIDGVVVGGDMECEEAECEGNEQEEAEKCGREGEAGEMGDGVVD